eukprot:g419.t1
MKMGTTKLCVGVSIPELERLPKNQASRMYVTASTTQVMSSFIRSERCKSSNEDVEDVKLRLQKCTDLVEMYDLIYKSVRKVVIERTQSSNGNAVRPRKKKKKDTNNDLVGDDDIEVESKNGDVEMESRDPVGEGGESKEEEEQQEEVSAVVLQKKTKKKKKGRKRKRR